MNLTKKLNYIVKVLLYLTLSVGAVQVKSQRLDLYTCYERAEDQSPLKQQENYLNTTRALNKLIDRNGYLPDFLLKATASYQSDVFELPFDPPGAEVPQIPKDQYQLSLNISQNIYDGGVVRSKKLISDADLDIRSQQLEVSLYKIKAVIDELYFAILTKQAEDQLNKELIAELENQLDRVRSAIQNGLLLPSSRLAIQREILIARQSSKGIQLELQALRDVLSDWIDEEISPETHLVLPDNVVIEAAIQRPELQLFENQILKYEASKSQLEAFSHPRVVGFANLGYGNPNPYNFFETEWSSFYMVGGRLEWRFWDWNSSRNKKQLLNINQNIVKTQRANFEKEINHRLIQVRARVSLLESAISTDRELIEIQDQIANEASRQFEKGVISSRDYITELNKLTQAELKLKMHLIQLSKLKVDYQTISGNIQEP